MEAQRPPRAGPASVPAEAGGVAAIASRFTGASLPTTHQAHLSAVEAAKRVQDEAAAAAATALHDWRADGEEALSRHLLLQRLEAYASRAAEREARDDLARFHGSGALALAWVRASLGLSVADDAVDALAHSGLPLEFTAESIDAARARAFEADGAPPPPPPPPPLARPLPLPPPPPPRPSGDDTSAADAAAVREAEASELMGLFAELVARHGAPLELGELSVKLHEQTRLFWGSAWEPRHGSLLAFVRAHLPRHHELVLTQNRWLSLAGMPPVPPPPRAPPAAAAASASGSAGDPGGGGGGGGGALALHSSSLSSSASHALVPVPPPWAGPSAAYAYRDRAGSSSSSAAMTTTHQWWDY